MKKVVLLMFFATCLIGAVNAQSYKTSFGGRLGYESGLTLKHFISDNKALEGLVSTRWNNIGLTALYEIHNPAFDIENLYWYYGGGVHAGIGNRYYSNRLAVGIDAIIGIEYTIRDLPLNVSLDWKPAIDVIGRFDVWAASTALSVRYVFK